MTFSPLVIVSAVLHAYVGWRLLPGLGALPWQMLLGAVLLLSAMLMPLALRGSRLLRQPWADRARWAGLLLMGLFSSLFVLTLLRDVALGGLWLLDAAQIGRAHV